jgi:hypothetical protein
MDDSYLNLTHIKFDHEGPDVSRPSRAIEPVVETPTQIQYLSLTQMEKLGTTLLFRVHPGHRLSALFQEDMVMS